ncbi:MAG TPA: prolipoprotein diacylglyceryl transferase [Anaerolineales bacterium]|nr:prolipoprotein diacylglyceryl transferase [Anaerolineales bacterium]
MQNLPSGFDIPLPFLNTTFHIYFYGILIMLGVVAAAFLGQAEARRRNINPDYIWDALFWLVLAGIVGARLWHVFSPPPSMVAQGITTAWYFSHPLDLINIRNGGLGIPGAIIGGAVALYFYCRSKKLSFLVLVDTVIPGVALAQAIGRWGNFFNQELYGKPTNLPWKIYIDAAHRIAGYENASYYHPLFLYESLWNLLNMALLLWLARRFEKWLKPGDIFYIYMIMYSIGRFCLEFLRLDASQVAGINFNQTFVIFVALAGGLFFFLNHRRRTAPVNDPD